MEPVAIFEPEVAFLKTALVLNGILEGDKINLTPRKFTRLIKSDPVNPSVDAGFRLAYGTDFLYIMLEIEKEKFVCRDRGYQNGDGMLLLLGTLKPGQKTTNEFFLFGFWPDPNALGGVQKMLWCYNGMWPMDRVDDSTKFFVGVSNGHVVFELCLAWKDAFPYHPWLTENMGFDLMYTEAVGTDGVNYHAIAFQEGNESASQEIVYSSVKLLFEQPVLDQGMQTYLIGSRHLFQRESLPILGVTIAAETGTENLRILTMAGETGFLAREDVKQACGAGLTRWKASIPTADLIPGGYQLLWNSRTNPSSGKICLSLLPRLDPQSEIARLDQLEGATSFGTLNTLRFRLQNIQQELARLKPYDICPELRIETEKYYDLVHNLEQGNDGIAGSRGVLRRAFCSKVDDTLQPYSILIPQTYAPKRQYPLLVFLHGSDRDDTELGRYKFLHALKDWIVLMPKGRGPRSYYTVDHAQQDIQEAIQDACTNYSIDERHMVVGGFSMGGYGAYRTYYETPDRYRGIAVFSGLPNIFEDAFPGCTNHPDFLKDKYLEPFKQINAFIFHGTGDRNAPYHLTERMIEKLKNIGAQITFTPQDDTGHSEPNEANQNTFYRWMDNILKA